MHRLHLTTALLLLVIFALALAACCGAPQGTAADGGRWFGLNHCNGCHGEEGSGGRGPAIAGTGLSFHRFLGKLRSPESMVMPPFPAEKVSDQDAADIYLWLQTKKR